jgi:hypothetical protein
MNMLKKILPPVCYLITITIILIALLSPANPVLAAGATASVKVTIYKEDKVTVQADKSVTYEWMEKNLPVYGDGKTHFFHQGPVFEGDVWDPGETVNLKDKGAVKGTTLKDLCDLVGGMTPGSEIVVHAVDGYELTLAYFNIYEPMDIQGPAVLCWYKGKDYQAAEDSGSGYPGNNAYSSALQLVFMAETTNSLGEHVFGNNDMKIALPEEKYQHFYEGLPSTNGLTAKWVDELRIYPGGAPAANDETAASSASVDDSVDNHKNLWLSIGLGIAGILAIFLGVYLFVRKRKAI